MEIVIKECRDRLLVFFGCLGNRFSEFLSLENKLENEAIFCENRGGPRVKIVFSCRRESNFSTNDSSMRFTFL